MSDRERDIRLASDDPSAVDFLAAIETVCRVHHMSISHEDGHGDFIIENFTTQNIERLHMALLKTKQNTD